LKIGVLAVQGDFAEHIAILRQMGVESSEVRLPHQLQDVDGLIIPGGESTTLSRLMSLYDLREPIAEMVQQGKAVWGTCAGMIMLAREITEEDPIPLGLMDIGVRRNAFGRQIDSFEQDLSVAGLQGGPFHAIFIRAPIITWVAEGVKVLAVVGEDTPVAVQQDRMMATAFHPELTNDTRIHRHFLNLISETVPSPRE
jgi:5'-phosphate synthase pdxT subunit